MEPRSCIYHGCGIEDNPIHEHTISVNQHIII